MISPLKKSHQILQSTRNNLSKLSNHYIPANSNKLQKLSKQKSIKNKQTHNLSSQSRISKLSNKSTHITSNQFYIKLPNSFYNDSKTSFYLNRSKTLSQKSSCYQVKPLTFTQRNKLQSSKLQSIVKRRKTQIQNDQNLQSSFNNNKQTNLSSLSNNPLNKSKRSQSSINFKCFPTSRTSYLLNSSPFKTYHESSINQSDLNNSILNKTQNNKSSYTKTTINQLCKTQRISLSNKFINHNVQKYNKLINGSKFKSIQHKILKNDIQRISSQRTIKKKWLAPFQNSNTLKSKFQGKQIVSTSTLKQKQQFFKNNNKTQLKVLNIDRMFRKKEGKLTSVVPLPLPKFSQVTAKKNVNLLTNKKNRDKIHDIIQEFNTLLRISKLQKARTTKIIGIKGKNFTKNPTFEQLMGLKLQPKKNTYAQQSQQIPQQIFMQHSFTYKQVINDNFQLKQNFISGIKQSNNSFNLQVLKRFYQLFVNKISSIQQKVKFFGYFFIPSGKQLIFKSQLIQMFSILCKSSNIPSININVKTQTLNQEQKARIFLQALIKVMFGQISNQQVMNRQMLSRILVQNQQAIDLLFKLIEKKQNQ